MNLSNSQRLTIKIALLKLRTTVTAHLMTDPVDPVITERYQMHQSNCTELLEVIEELDQKHGRNGDH